LVISAILNPAGMLAIMNDLRRLAGIGVSR
jgi:hypothetical protein